MTKSGIIKALKALNRELAAEASKAEICLYGGTAMIFAFNARLSTKDVDAVFRPKTLVRLSAEKIADELGLARDWLNDGVKGFLSAKGSFTEEDLPQFSHIQVIAPTASYLLAMKCIAARAPGYDTKGDRADILLLMKRLKITTETEALDLVEQYYPRKMISPKTQFMILECLEEIKDEPAGPR